MTEEEVLRFAIHLAYARGHQDGEARGRRSECNLQRVSKSVEQWEAEDRFHERLAGELGIQGRGEGPKP